jgi:signal peptidase I
MENQESGKKQIYKSHRIRNGFFFLLSAALVLAIALVLTHPVYRIYGTAMLPGLSDGDIVIAVKDDQPKQGDVVALSYNNKVLIRRVIAVSGDEVDIDRSGNVFVNGGLLQESYLSGKSYESCDIQLPCKVEDKHFFVMGDNRSLALDSRQTEIGCPAAENVLGKAAFRIWPLHRIGRVK